MLTNPMLAAIICSRFAERSPPAVAVALLKPLAILFDNINRWLGPGVLINASTVPR